MSNPYFVPRDNSRQQNMLGLATLAAQLYGLKQRGDIAGQEAEIGREKNQLTREDIGLRREVEFGANGVPGARQTASMDAESRRMAAESEAAKIPEHRKNFGYGDRAIAAIAFKRLGLKDDNPVMQRVSELAADKSITKESAYRVLHDDQEMQQATIEGLSQKIQKAAEKDPSYLDTKQGQQDYQVLQQISTAEGWGQAVDSAMSTTVRSMQTEQQNSKAALLEQRLTGIEERQRERLESQEDVNQARLESQKEISDAKVKAAGEVARLQAQTSEKVAQARLEAAKGISATEQRVTAKSIADAEEKILSNKNEGAAAGQADYFNQYADKPYAYVWNENKGSLRSATFEKVKLPKIKGVQVTAKHVYEKAAADGITYDEVLKMIGVLK